MRGNKTIKISYKNLKLVSLFFLILPVVIFLFFFVKRIISIPAIILLILAYLWVFRQKDDNNYFHIKPFQLLLILLTCFIWCYFGGLGGLFYQTSDWNERNAIFRDLLSNKWPVYYPVTDTTLTYYIGHWLPAALIGRSFFTFTGNWGLSWIIGNISLLIWTALSIFLCILLLLNYLALNDQKWQWMAIGILITFSGLDIVGCILQGWSFQSFTSILHLEWWLVDFQFSSNTTCLFWVFNQAVPAWIATLLFINEKSNRIYALIIVCTLISAPLPCIGLAFFMVGYAIFKMTHAIKKHSLISYLKETFSIVNILPTLFIFPILAAYLMTNSALENTDAMPKENIYFNNNAFILGATGVCALLISKWLIKKQIPEVFTTSIMLLLISAILFLNPHLDYTYTLFLFLEVGIYFIMISSEKYKDVFFYLAIVLFFIAPIIKIGIASDFCMRATIPATIILMLMYSETLIKWMKTPEIVKKSRYYLAIFILIIGMATPLMEFYRGMYKVTEGQRIALVADNIYTLNQYHPSGKVYGNFVSETYKKSLFFKYLAQK